MPEINDVFVQAANNTGIKTYPEYSGRSMYGRKCFGVVVSSVSEFVQFILECAAIATDDNEMGLDALTRATHDAKSDSMGYDTIYYFPRVTLTEEQAGNLFEG